MNQTELKQEILQLKNKSQSQKFLRIQSAKNTSSKNLFIDSRKTIQAATNNNFFSQNINQQKSQFHRNAPQSALNIYNNNNNDKNNNNNFQIDSNIQTTKSTNNFQKPRITSAKSLKLNISMNMFRTIQGQQTNIVQTQKNLEQNKQHRYFLNERPQTANSYKFLFLTQPESYPSVRLQKKMQQEKENLGKSKQIQEREQVNSKIETIKNVLKTENQEEQQKLFNEITSKKPKNKLEKDQFAYLLMKHNLEQMYEKDFNDYIQKNQKTTNKCEALKVQEDKVQEEIQKRKEKYDNYLQNYNKNFKDQKSAIHDYLEGKKVDQNLVVNYKHLLKPQMSGNYKIPKPFEIDIKETKIQSKVHKNMNFPGYKEKRVKIENLDKKRLKEYIAQFMKGEKKYFQKLNEITKKVESELHFRMDLNDKWYEHRMYEPEKPFLASDDLNIPSKEVQLALEQKQIFDDLKNNFDTKVEYENNKIKYYVEPISPRVKDIHKKIQSNKEQQIQNRFNQLRYTDHKLSIVQPSQSQNLPMRYSKAMAMSLSKQSIKPNEEKVEYLKSIKQQLDKHNKFKEHFNLRDYKLTNKEEQNAKAEKQYIEYKVNDMKDFTQSIKEDLQELKCQDGNQKLNRLQEKFLHAVKNNLQNEVKAYLNVDSQYFLTTVNSVKQNALHLAARRGHREMVQFLLKQGARIGDKDNRGRTAAQVALKALGKNDILTIELQEVENYTFRKREQINLLDYMPEVNRFKKKLMADKLEKKKHQKQLQKQQRILYKQQHKLGHSSHRNSQQILSQSKHSSKKQSNNNSIIQNHKNVETLQSLISEEESGSIILDTEEAFASEFTSDSNSSSEIDDTNLIFRQNMLNKIEK